MRLPVCVVDLESGVLCASCQEKLDKGQITEVDVDISKWLLAREGQFPTIADLNLSRALKVAGRLVLVVKKKGREILLSAPDLLEELRSTYGEVVILEGPANLRNLVRGLIHPATEVGVNNLYLPDGSKECIVMLHADDKSKIPYSLEDLRQIVSAVMQESVLFQYQEELTGKKPGPTSDAFDEKLKDFARKQPRR
jgi:hypothetical protein